MDKQERETSLSIRLLLDCVNVIAISPKLALNAHRETNEEHQTTYRRSGRWQGRAGVAAGLYAAGGLHHRIGVRSGVV
jgi:hypothetical protein